MWSLQLKMWLTGLCMASIFHLYPLISLCLSLYQLLLLFSFNFLLAATFPLRLHDFFIPSSCLSTLSPPSLPYFPSFDLFVLIFLACFCSIRQHTARGVRGGGACWLACVAEAHLSPADPPRLQATHYSHPLFFFEFFSSPSTAFTSAILFLQEKREFDHNKQREVKYFRYFF